MLSLAHLIGGIFFIMVSASSTIAHAYDVTLAWDPNDEPDLAGYILYVNEDGAGFPYYQLDTISLDEIVAENPMYTATELEENRRHCFVVTAYNTEGFEGGFSNEVCVINGQDTSINLSHDSGNNNANFSQAESSGSGGGCFITISNEKPSIPLF